MEGDGVSEGGGDAGRPGERRRGSGASRTVRISVEEHRCLVDTLRACVAAADAASALLGACSPPDAPAQTHTHTDADEMLKEADETETSTLAGASTSVSATEDRQHYLQSVIVLQKQRSDLVRMLSQALGALEQITDAQGRRAGESSTTLPNSVEKRRINVTPATRSRKKREMRRAPTVERRHKSSPEIGMIIAERSQSSVRSRKHRYSRLRERDRRISKRACGVIRVIVRKRLAESEPLRQKEQKDLDNYEGDSERNNEHKMSPRASPKVSRNNKYEMNSRNKYVRTNSPALKTKFSQISERKVRAKRIKTSLDRLLTSKSDKSNFNLGIHYSKSKDSKYKKRSPLTIEMCVKQSRNKALENSKIGLLGTRNKVSGTYRDENRRSSDSDQGNGIKRTPLNSANRRNSARLPRNGKSGLGSNLHDQFQDITL